MLAFMARKRAKDSRKIKFAVFVYSYAKIAGGASPPQFFRLYEKSTKKVHGGLASPLDSRGRRQIFKI